jgi:hypothetical protein
MNRNIFFFFTLFGCLLSTSPILKAQSSANESYVIEELVFPMSDDLKRFVKSDIPFTKEKKAIINAHNSNQKDTCATYTFKSSNIVLYELPNKVFPSTSSIKNPELVFRNGLKVGLSRSDIDKIISKQTESDFVELTDLEYNTVFKLEFKNDTLSTIRFSGYVD